MQLVHPLLTTPEERAILKARGVSYSTSPTGEARRPSSLGVIQLGELLEAGVKVSLSTDHTTNYNCDPFVAMRILFALHQHRIGNKIPLTLKRLVQLATLDGAVDLGIADKTGSLTPGKRADIILVRTTDTNMAPAGDPYEALVSRAQPTQYRYRDRGWPHSASVRQVHVARPPQGLARSPGGGRGPAHQGKVAGVSQSLRSEK